MTPESYQEMSLIEQNHWWFVARRQILDMMILHFIKPNGKILEIGAGTGGNIKMLLNHGEVTVIEPNGFACQKIHDKFEGQITIVKGALPDSLNLQDRKFDLICLFDVLEHVEEDCDSLIILKRHLKPGGKIIITVPAMQFLWSKHDENLHHYRRYNLSSVNGTIKNSGLKIVKIGYFNFLLFLPALIFRLFIEKFTPNRKIKKSLPIFNSILRKIFSIERHLLKSNIRFPFGLSIFAIITDKNN